jgi:DNA-binding cell septation regulator SpoVG
MSTNGSFKATDWKAVEKGALKGFFSLMLPSGLIIKECKLFDKGEGRWIGFPSRSYQNNQGETKYSDFIAFDGPDTKQRFTEAGLAALDEVLGKKGVEVTDEWGDFK